MSKVFDHEFDHVALVPGPTGQGKKGTVTKTGPRTVKYTPTSPGDDSFMVRLQLADNINVADVKVKVKGVEEQRHNSAFSGTALLPALVAREGANTLDLLAGDTALANRLIRITKQPEHGYVAPTGYGYLENEARQWAGVGWSVEDFAARQWAARQWSARQWSARQWSARQWSARQWAGVGWSGVGWSGVGWSGVGWSGVKWSARQWAGVGWSDMDFAGVEWSGVKWSGVKWSGVGWSDLNLPAEVILAMTSQGTPEEVVTGDFSKVIYIPEPGYSGPDSFEYEVYSPAVKGGDEPAYSRVVSLSVTSQKASSTPVPHLSDVPALEVNEEGDGWLATFLVDNVPAGATRLRLTTPGGSESHAVEAQGEHLVIGAVGLPDNATTVVELQFTKGSTSVGLPLRQTIKTGPVEGTSVAPVFGGAAA